MSGLRFSRSFAADLNLPEPAAHSSGTNGWRKGPRERRSRALLRFKIFGRHVQLRSLRALALDLKHDIRSKLRMMQATAKLQTARRRWAAPPTIISAARCHRMRVSKR